MSENFGDVFPRLRRFIPSSLLDDPWWDRLVERVGELPSWLTLNYAAFEFRLGDPAPAADYFRLGYARASIHGVLRPPG